MSSTGEAKPNPNFSDPEFFREYRRVRVAACRAKKNRIVEDLQDAINAKRAILDLPPKDFSKKSGVGSRKGKTRPKYEPPPEMLKNMTKAQISEWKSAERKKRRNLKGREEKAKADQYVDGLQAELRDLEQQVRVASGEVHSEAVPLEDANSFSVKSKHGDVTKATSIKDKTKLAQYNAMKQVETLTALRKQVKMHVAETTVHDEKTKPPRLDDMVTSQRNTHVPIIHNNIQLMNDDISITSISFQFKDDDDFHNLTTVFDDVETEYSPSNPDAKIEFDFVGMAACTAPINNDDLSAISCMNLSTSKDFSVEGLIVEMANENDNSSHMHKQISRKVSMEPTKGDDLVPVNNAGAFIPDPNNTDWGANDGGTVEMGCLEFEHIDEFSIEENIFDKHIARITPRDADPIFERPFIGTS